MTEYLEEDDIPTEEVEELHASYPKVWTPQTITYFGPATRSILLSGEITQQLADALCSQIISLSLENDELPIVVYINTTGGSVIDALAIYDALKINRCPIVTIVQGACFSAGLIILSAGDIRLATPHSVFFYHQPIMENSELFSMETVNSAVKSYMWSRDKLDAIIRTRSGLSKKKWKKYFEGKVAFYFGTDEALKHGMIDDILQYKDKPKIEIMEKEWQSEVKAPE